MFDAPSLLTEGARTTMDELVTSLDEALATV